MEQSKSNAKPLTIGQGETVIVFSKKYPLGIEGKSMSKLRDVQDGSKIDAFVLGGKIRGLRYNDKASGEYWLPCREKLPWADETNYSGIVSPNTMPDNRTIHTDNFKKPQVGDEIIVTEVTRDRIYRGLTKVSAAPVNYPKIIKFRDPVSLKEKEVPYINPNMFQYTYWCYADRRVRLNKRRELLSHSEEWDKKLELYNVLHFEPNVKYTEGLYGPCVYDGIEVKEQFNPLNISNSKPNVKQGDRVSLFIKTSNKNYLQFTGIVENAYADCGPDYSETRIDVVCGNGEGNIQKLLDVPPYSKYSTFYLPIESPLPIELQDSRIMKVGISSASKDDRNSAVSPRPVCMLSDRVLEQLINSGQEYLGEAKIMMEKAGNDIKRLQDEVQEAEELSIFIRKQTDEYQAEFKRRASSAVDEFLKSKYQ